MTISPLVAQSWQDVRGRTDAGLAAVRQSARDLAADAFVLLVASHPDDRYLLPAVWLRGGCGYRVGVLLATRGGGAQNSLGPETGDLLERIRTLETEVGCAACGAETWYLNRPDGGYCRTAAETFAEWGREGTLRELVRLLRKIRPDAVITTHHQEEGHGHDLAVVELLEEAMLRVNDPDFDVSGEPHSVPMFLVGAGSTITPTTVSIDADRLDPDRGLTLRRIAHNILGAAHRSPGRPNALDAIFDPVLRFEPRWPEQVDATGRRALGLPSVLDPDRWPGDPQRARELDRFLREQLPQQLQSDNPPFVELVRLRGELEALRDSLPEAAAPGREASSTQPGDVDAFQAMDARVRLQRRIDALDRLLLAASRVQIEVEPVPGAVAIAGEEVSASVRVLTGRGLVPTLAVVGLAGIEAKLTPLVPLTSPASSLHASLTLQVPLDHGHSLDPMAERFRADRFEAPVRVRFDVGLHGLQIPVEVTVPVMQLPPVELSVVPRMLLLPSARETVQFSVGVHRNSRFPVQGELDVRAPAGYAIADHRHSVELRSQRSDLFGLDVTAPPDRRTGVDVLRIQLGGTRVVLPVHKVDVAVPENLSVGVLRSLDDTLPSVLGVGGLGLTWSELSDADIAAADLGLFDTVVVDIRALRNRPAARRGFGRLLDFARMSGKRLVLFYQKKTELHPAGEAFRGAPFLPFEVGSARVTRADAPIRVLRKDHVLLNHPNVIRKSDWDGWVQERGLYLPQVYSDDYEEVLELHDPGQPAERGALLYARTGDGEYVYCALALWRQLKKLHPGAVRLLVNLLTPSERH
ncbi:MAG: PIG-L family deacetylase [Planctomycetota bacterium]